jgi:Kef-type K+ transport system membrane component KefB
MNLFDLNLTLPISDPTWVFFLVLIIILFAPMILGRLHIPHIIGMILAGVLIGEHGFHVLDRDSSFELFGKVGLYYIMFLAGLEMDMEDFKKNRTKSFVFGWLTFLIPMALGIWSSMSMLGYGFLTAVLLASMYASHTLIAYPIISRYGLSRKRGPPGRPRDLAWCDPVEHRGPGEGGKPLAGLGPPYEMVMAPNPG